MNSDFQFTTSDFESVSKIAFRMFGLNLEPSKKQLVYSRLSKRLRALRINSFREYLNLIDSGETPEEVSNFLSALTTNVTHFFREAHHFDKLRDDLIPSIKTRSVASGQPIRIWSAGCSSGPEPISIAVTIAENFPSIKAKGLKILATDIDRQILKKAKLGSYKENEMTGVSEALRKKYFNQNRDNSEYSVKFDLLSEISFRQLNLVDKWPISVKFDVIFCRNVAIYFDKNTQEKLWLNFANSLNEGGCLMIGHSERVSGPASDLLKPNGVTSYVKQQLREA